MGLIQAAAGSLTGLLADQWREYFYCDALDADTLARKGVKRTSKRSSNTKGSDNIISSGSVISVADGQCMLIVEQGKVVDVCAVTGEYVYDASTEPSVFYGDLGQTIAEAINAFGKRFTFGGEVPKDQRVYYINTKELVGNKYGTPTPVPFRVVDRNIGLDMDIDIRCFGEYSYRISNPVLFYTNVCGNFTGSYTRANLDSQLKTELLTALQPAFARISEMGIRYSSLPGHAMELAQALNEALSAKWRDLRGLEIVSVGVSSVSANEEDTAMIRELQRNATLRNPAMAGAHLTAAQAEAMKAAAANTSAGSAMAFMGMNMANQTGGINAENLFKMAQTQQPQNPHSTANGWRCGCGAVASGKFCTECGAKRPESNGWTCACGSVNKGKFCPECGAKKPAGAVQYRCDKCGWEPADKGHPPKFCPECGDPFDNGDIL